MLIMSDFLGIKTAFFQILYNIFVKGPLYIVHGLGDAITYLSGQKVFINSDSVFFQKIIEMEYKEIFDEELNINQLQQENKQLKNEIELLKHWMGYTLLDTNYVDKWTN